MSLRGLSNRHRYHAAAGVIAATASVNLQTAVSHCAKLEGWFDKSLAVTETESSVEQMLHDVSVMVSSS